MTIQQARKLQKGDKVRQKMFGYILTVDSVSEMTTVLGAKTMIIVKYRTEKGEIMKHNHKELTLPI